MNALSRMIVWIGGWRRRNAALWELARIGPEGRAALARDMGVSPGSLARLAKRGPGVEGGLRRLLRALEIDVGFVARVDPAVIRDMELTCAECRATARCERDLRSGAARAAYKGYCPNSAAIVGLPGPPPADAIAGEAPLSPSSDERGDCLTARPRHWTWPLAGRVERQARLMDAMMERLGVDPRAIARDGGGTVFAAASRSCLACANSDACEEWLERDHGDPSAFCPNAAFFRRNRTASGSSNPGA